MEFETGEVYVGTWALFKWNMNNHGNYMLLLQALLLLATLAYAEEEAAKPTVLYAAHYPYYGYAGLHYPYALAHHALVKPYT